MAVISYVNSGGGSSSSGGMTTQGSANYGSGGSSGTDCSATYPAYKPGCNTNVEPADPRAQGSFKDFGQGILVTAGAGLADSADLAYMAFTPWCSLTDRG
ncbi:hypothetical protein ACSHXN_45515 (plasmid) [Streptomyces sp. HUAS TT11]|uniref:hypothetical protein n=1 Tax=Streptomyces sp. HUAS TT11 TaxID=3447508 RepID=UPI003F65D398